MEAAVFDVLVGREYGQTGGEEPSIKHCEIDRCVRPAACPSKHRKEGNYSFCTTCPLTQLTLRSTGRGWLVWEKNGQLVPVAKKMHAKCRWWRSSEVLHREAAGRVQLRRDAAGFRMYLAAVRV